MAGLAQLGLGTIPVAGGALLGVAAGQLKAPDYRPLAASCVPRWPKAR